MADGAMTAFLGTMGEFFTQTMEWSTELISTITGSAPLTVLVFGFAVVGFGVGIFKRIVG